MPKKKTRKKKASRTKAGTRRRGRPRGPNRSDEEILADLEEQLAAMKKRVEMARQFKPERVLEERDRLELSAADYSVLVGVTPLTIYNWEHGRSRPRAAQLERWLDVYGIGKREAWDRLGYE